MRLLRMTPSSIESQGYNVYTSIVSTCLAFIRLLAPLASVRPPKGEDWLHEPKFDGFWFQAIRDGAGAQFYSQRSKRRWSAGNVLFAAQPCAKAPLRNSVAIKANQSRKSVHKWITVGSCRRVRDIASRRQMGQPGHSQIFALHRHRQAREAR